MLAEYYCRLFCDHFRQGLYKKRLKRLQRKYGFNDWHLSPLFERDYANYIVCTVHKFIVGGVNTLVDVGCGLGEIVGNIQARSRYGFDINENNIRAAGELYPGVNFRNGSFQDIHVGGIDVLCMVNFTFVIPPDELKKQIDLLRKNNTISVFVIDTFLFNDNTEYIFSHDGNYLFSNDYRLLKRSRPFYHAGKAGKAIRYIEFWGRKFDF